MSTLYLDQSLSRTGFMLWKNGEALISGSWPLSTSAPEMRGIGLVQFFGHLNALHQAHTLEQIVHEKPVFGAPNQGEDELIGQIGLIGIIELFSNSRGLPVPRSYSPTSWRTSFFTPDERRAIKAKAPKFKDWKRRALLRAQQYGFEPSSHDEAEAIGIGDHDLMKHKITPPWRLKALELPSVV